MLIESPSIIVETHRREGSVTRNRKFIEVLYP